MAARPVNHGQYVDVHSVPRDPRHGRRAISRSLSISPSRIAPTGGVGSSTRAKLAGRCLASCPSPKLQWGQGMFSVGVLIVRNPLHTQSRGSGAVTRPTIEVIIDQLSRANWYPPIYRKYQFDLKRGPSPWVG